MKRNLIFVLAGLFAVAALVASCSSFSSPAPTPKNQTGFFNALGEHIEELPKNSGRFFYKTDTSFVIINLDKQGKIIPSKPKGPQS